MTHEPLARREESPHNLDMHPQTRLALEFLGWKSRFDDSTELPPHGASCGEILASLTSEERATAESIVAGHGRAHLVQYWSLYRTQLLHVRSL